MINKQDYLNSIEQNIDMVRGDTLEFDFQIQGLGDAEATFEFTCADEYGESPVFTAEVGNGITLEANNTDADIRTYSVCIRPEQTASLDVTMYYYRLLMSANGDVLTLMKGSLNLLNDVERG